MTRFLAALAHARACSYPELGAGPCTPIDYVLGFLIAIAFGGFIVGCIAATIKLSGFPIGQVLRKYSQTYAVVAAAALACVCSPAMAAAPADLTHAFVSGIFALTFGCAALALVLCVVWRLPLFGLVAAACLAILAVGLGLSPALADVVATTSATTPVVITTATLPWGDWLVAVLQPVSAVLVPLAAAAVTAGIAKYAPWAASVATKDRVEAAIQAGAAYGQNAVEGVAKGKTVTVNLGSAVVAAGAQHVIDEAPARVIKAAGGVEGIATRIFRALPLEDNASAQNVLQPALAALKRQGVGAK